MNFPLYVARRYLKSKSGNHIINIVTFLSCIGIVGGTIALFLVLSVFSGIKNYGLNILNFTTPDIRMLPTKGKIFLADKTFFERIEKISDDIHFTRILQERAFFKSNEKEEIAYIRGVDSAFNQVIPMDAFMMVGNWFSKDENACIVDYHLLRKLELNLYRDIFKTYIPKVGKGYSIDLNQYFTKVNMRIKGVLSEESQEDNDNACVYIPLRWAQQLLEKSNDEVSYVDISVKESSDVHRILDYLEKSFPEHKITKRDELNGSFYKILNSERLVAYLISLLIIIMVLFNTSGTMIMTIVDKKNDIKIILDMGATFITLKRIYIFYIFFLSLLGMSIGLVISIFLIYIQTECNLIMISSSVPYPIVFEWKNLFITAFTIIFSATLSSFLAIGQISPQFVARG